MSISRFPRRAAVGVALLMVLLFCSVAGCRRGGEITLHQPSAPPSQRELELAGSSTFCATHAGRRSYLLAFPLPGAEDGPRDFLMYLSTPDARGRWRVDPDSPEAVRGFMIQGVGRLAGKTCFTGGTVRCRKVWFAPRLCRLDFDVRCDDRTRITGTAYVESAAQEVHIFEQRYAADLALLSSPTSPPSAPDGGTPQRATASP